MESVKINQSNCLKLYQMEDVIMLWCGIHWQDLERIKTTDSKVLPKELKTAYRRIKTMLLNDIKAGHLKSVMQDGVTRAASNLSTGHKHFYHFWHDDLIAYVEQYHPHNRPDFLFNTDYFQNPLPDSHYEKTESTEKQAFHEQPLALKLANQAFSRFWANANPAERDTQPKNKDVQEWLMQQSKEITSTQAKHIAQIIRPKWAVLGRKENN